MKWKAALVLLLVFAAGVVTGGGLTRWRIERRVAEILRAPFDVGEAKLYVWLLDRRLKLTGDQKDAVEKISRDTHPEVVRALKKAEPELSDVRHKRQRMVREILKDDPQRRAFDEMTERFEARRKEAFGP